MLVEGEGHVAGAAAQVEDDGLGTSKDGTHGAGGASPPEAVDARREQVVEQVVARSDGVEHLLDVLRRSGRIGDAGGARSEVGFGLGFCCHKSYVKRLGACVGRLLKL